jgi:hypothetical protein
MTTVKTRGVTTPPNKKSHPEIWMKKDPSRGSEQSHTPNYGKAKSGWHEWKNSSLSQVASSLVWLLHCTLKNLIVLHCVMQSFGSKILTGCSGYIKSASSGATSGNTTSTGAFKHLFSCDTWKITWTPANDGGNSNLYATFPHFQRMGNGPM